jgi:hypothetical protein
LHISSGSLAIFAAIRRVLGSSPKWLRNLTTELFNKRASRVRIRKTPSKKEFTFSNKSPSMPRLNFSRPVKVQHPAAHFDIQYIIVEDKLDDVGIFPLVCDCLPVKSLGHITPAGNRDNAIRLLADKHRQLGDIRRDPPPLILA